MKHSTVLFLGEANSPLLAWLREQGEAVIQTNSKISVEFVEHNNIFFIVSYGYRHILKKDILELFPSRAINLHISYLPWNRGADPNFWSFVEDTPKGITIHYLDEGVDTGDIIVQKEIEFDSDRETLSTSYEKLQAAIQDLFKEAWPAIKSGKCPRQKQFGIGSTHKTKDKDGLLHLLTDGWNTPVSVFDEYAAEMQMSKQFWEKYDAEIETIAKQKKA